MKSTRIGRNTVARSLAALSPLTLACSGLAGPAHGAVASVAPIASIASIAGTGPHYDAALAKQASAIRFSTPDGHTYVLPASVLASGKPFDPAAYEDRSRSSRPAPKYTAAAASAPTRQVEIHADGLDGLPAAATAFLINVDDSVGYREMIPVVDGVGQATAPVGNYAMITVFTSTTADGHTAFHIVVANDFAVPAGSSAFVATVDERAASSEVRGATPRPATTDMSFVTLDRGDALGGHTIVQENGDGPLWISPQPEAVVGTFSYQVVWGGKGGEHTPDPYRYDLMFAPAKQIVPNQAWPVDPTKLAVQHNTFGTDAALAGKAGRFAVTFVLADGGGFFSLEEVPTPSRLTEYLSAPVTGAYWFENYNPDFDDVAKGLIQLSPRSVSGAAVPGRESWRTWAHGPLTPQAGIGDGTTFCSVCGSGDQLNLGLVPVVDSELASEGFADGAVTENLAVYRDGTQVFNGGTHDATLTGVPSTPATYRMVYDQDLSGLGLTQSAVTHTDLGFRYDPTAGPVLPAEDDCVARGSTGGPCRIQPVLTLGYRLDTDIVGVSHSPIQTLDLTVTHQSYDGQGSTATITRAEVSVSYDQGRTWLPALVAPGLDGHYAASWTNLGGHGTKPWLKISAADAVGGSISQTIQSAYSIG